MRSVQARKYGRRMTNKILFGALAALCCVPAFGAPAASALTLGQAVAPTGVATGPCVNNETDVQPAVASGASYQVPLAGNITSFATRAWDSSATRASVRLVVFRVTGPGVFRVVGISAAHQVPAADPVVPVSTNITAIPALAGDIIGFRFTGTSGTFHCYQDGVPGDIDIFNDVATLSVGSTFSGTSTAARISLSAFMNVQTVVTAEDTTSPDYRMRATLTDSAGRPISGQTITFTTGGMPICSATTNSNGVATCFANTQDKTVIASINTNGFTARFAGNTGLLADTDHGGFGSPTGPPGVKG